MKTPATNSQSKFSIHSLTRFYEDVRVGGNIDDVIAVSILCLVYFVQRTSFQYWYFLQCKMKEISMDFAVI